MKTTFKLNKGISSILLIIILFQYCSIYKKKPSTIEEAISKKNTHIKLTTIDGHIYKLRWIEEKDGHVYSITDTKRVYIQKKRLSNNQDIYFYRFIKIEDQDDYIKGYNMTGKDTATVLIPIENVAEIKLISQNKTVGFPLMIFGILLFSFPLIVLLAWTMS